MTWPFRPCTRARVRWLAPAVARAVLVAALVMAPWLASGCGASPDDERTTELVYFDDEAAPGRASRDATPAASAATARTTPQSADGSVEPGGDTRQAVDTGGPDTAGTDGDAEESAPASAPSVDDTDPAPADAAPADPSPAPPDAPSVDDDATAPGTDGQPRIRRVVDDTQLTDIELPDQFNRTHTIRFPTDRIVVLAVGDRDGSPQLDGWTVPLWERFGDAIAIHGIALLDRIDPFFRGFVAGVIRNQHPHRPVLLDWTGDVTRPLGCEPAVANLYVVDRDGRPRLLVVGKYTDRAFERLVEEITRLRGTGGTDGH